MNAQAIAVERGYGRPSCRLSRALSLGGLVGAAVAGAVMAAASGVSRTRSSRARSRARLSPGRCHLSTVPPETGARAPTFAWPSPTLLGSGVSHFWPRRRRRDGGLERRVSARLAGNDRQCGGHRVAAFSLAWRSDGFTGDALVERFGFGVVLRRSSALAALGLGSALAIGTPPVAVLGFGAVGVRDRQHHTGTLPARPGRCPGWRPARRSRRLRHRLLRLLAGPALIGLHR